MLKLRVLTALVLLPVMLAALFAFDSLQWAAFTALITVLGLWEWSRLVKLSRLQQITYLGLSCAGLGAWATFSATVAYSLPLVVHGMVLVFWFVVAPLWLKQRWSLLQQPLLAMGLGWLLLLPAWSALQTWRPSPTAASLLLALMALVWLADTAAYFSGKTFGRRKLAPAISPGKSWEGVYGALVAVAIYAAILAQTKLLQPWALPVWMWVVVAWALTAVSIVGDLLESWFKRQAGMKDSSQLLPGHGGVLDRIDSLIAVLAVAAALQAYLSAF